MAKRLVLILFIVFFIGSLSAITINEVELNPAGDDIGLEWVEFYSQDNTNLEGYRIINNDGDEIALSGSFQGYFIYMFSKQWLDNSDEKVFLYNGNNLIDETSILVDSVNNGKTWQFCEEWSFADSTKGTKNCEKQAVEEEPEKTTIRNYSEEEIDNIVDNGTINPIKGETENAEESLAKNNQSEDKNSIETIKLKSQSLKTENSFDLKENFAKYSLVTFCLLLVLLFLLKGKKYKNEFQRSKKN